MTNVTIERHTLNPQKGELWHKWLGNISTGDKNLSLDELIACFKFTGVEPDLNNLIVTLKNSKVTCQTCLEIIHS